MSILEWFIPVEDFAREQQLFGASAEYDVGFDGYNKLTTDLRYEY